MLNYVDLTALLIVNLVFTQVISNLFRISEEGGRRRLALIIGVITAFGSLILNIDFMIPLMLGGVVGIFFHVLTGGVFLGLASIGLYDIPSVNKVINSIIPVYKYKKNKIKSKVKNRRRTGKEL